MAYLFTTGWEHGSVTWMTKLGQRDAVISSSIKKTGNHSVFVDCSNQTCDYTLDFGSEQAEVYISVWVYPTVVAGAGSKVLGVRFSDGSIVSIRSDVDRHWDAYVAGVKVADGNIVWELNTWHHVMLHVKIDDTVGQIETYIDGLDDLAYIGDTKPAAIATVRLFEFIGYSSNYYLDDLVIGTGGWMGDIRVYPFLPAAPDTATVEWDLSTGVDHYAVVDEHPPSDADYAYTGVTAEKEKVNTDTVALGTSVPVVVQTWARARKDTADANQIKIIIDDGVEDVGAAKDLTTSFAYYTRIDAAKPSGGAWTQGTLDALVLGAESVIA